MTTINPADCLPHEVYEGTANGERWTMQRLDPNSRLAWSGFRHAPHHGWFPDADVSSLVRLVPARPVTRDDLPKSMALSRVYLAADGDVEYGFEVALDAVVEHLNRAHPKPEPMSADSTYRIPREDYAYVDWPATCAAANERADRAEAEASRWRRAHAIVEAERDQAREQWKKWEHKADGWKARAEAVERERDEWRAEVEHTERLLDDRDDLYVQRERMERERDEWKARAERERDEARQVERESEDLRKKMKSLLDGVSEALNGPKPEWGSWGYHDLPEKARAAVARAEAAEARTAVTRDEVEAALAQGHRMAFGMPVVSIEEAAEAVCALFGVEAEPADPVEAKAREIATVAYSLPDFIDAFDVADDDAKAAYRRIAAHVLGQETNQ